MSHTRIILNCYETFEKFLPYLVPYFAFINILALPYTFWSVWYQKAKARQWCPLCLNVMILLWIIFILNILFRYIGLPVFEFREIQLAGCIYAIPVFMLNLTVPLLGEGRQVERLRQEINSFKASDRIFKVLLTQQSYHEVSRNDSQLLFGNPDVRMLVTVFSNPFCNPCAKMHERIEKLLKDTKGGVCIQYIFTSLKENLDYANRSLIAGYMEKDRVEAMRLYSDWFGKGKTLREVFFSDMQLDMSNPAVEVEFQKHESWKKKAQLRSTPTILVNGFELPENYKVEDLQYFTRINLD